MSISLPFDLTKPVSGEASIEFDHPAEKVFSVIGENFFENYPKWALEVSDFHPLDGKDVHVGAKARQIRSDNGSEVTSVFEIKEYEPASKLVIQDINAQYRQSYLLSGQATQPPACLTFRFELLGLDVFMRPFEKLIRYAIEEGAENTVRNIKELVCAECV